MIVISDTSVISNLIQLNQLELLKLVFQEVVIPDQVYIELCELETQKIVLIQTDWIVKKSATNFSLMQDLLAQVDPGEAAAIALALELKADYLLIDERIGRQVAMDYGLKIAGLLGVLLIAKNEGHLQAIQPLMDELVFKIGFRIHPELYHQMLKQAGE